MASTTVSIGIVFMGLVCAFVGGTALALVLFLHHRWSRLDATMRAYTWFWWFTSLVWTFSGVRYLLAGFGVAVTTIYRLDILVQASVFFSGPVLFYFITMKVFHRPRLANVVGVLSFVSGLLAVWFVVQPRGIPLRDVTFFSAEATVNTVSFMIFSVEAALILFLLLYDIVNRLYTWRQHQTRVSLYQALYSATVVIYLVLGSVDESKVITDWPLVVFRLLYSGAFLTVYLTIVRTEAMQEQYLLTELETAGFATYG